MPLTQKFQELSSTFERDGYVVLPGIVSKTKLADLTQKLRSEFARAKENGDLFSGGGTITGHLNCFPGAELRFVYEELEQKGIFDLIRKLSPAAVRMPNVGCNMNLPHSSSQNSHVDGYAATPFIIVNVAAVDTDVSNGATEIVPGTHTRDYKYWQYALSGKPAIRLKAKRWRRVHPLVVGLASRHAEQDRRGPSDAGVHVGERRQHSPIPTAPTAARSLSCRTATDKT